MQKKLEEFCMCNIPKLRWAVVFAMLTLGCNTEPDRVNHAKERQEDRALFWNAEDRIYEKEYRLRLLTRCADIRELEGIN